jgi:tetratricopeptide (TPR) repeat protein
MLQSDALWRTYAWFEKNKRQVLLATGAAVVIGLIVYFIIWQKEEKQAEAGRALSTAFASQAADPQSRENPDTYLGVAKQFPGSKAAERAALLAATSLFAQGKYEPALAEFQKFARENTGSPFMSQAMLGIAATLDAQGKSDQALEAYTSVVERYPNSPVLAQAKFSQARLRQAKGELERALTLYEDVAKDQMGALGNEAGMRAEELKQKHPDIAAKVLAKGTVLAPTATNAAPAPGVKK